MAVQVFLSAVDNLPSTPSSTPLFRYLPNPLAHLTALFTWSLTILTSYSENSNRDHAVDRAITTYRVLQHQYYNTTSGLYDTTGWWNSANAITTIANLAIVVPGLSSEIKDILTNTFVQAPRYNPTNYDKSVDPETFLVTTSWTVGSNEENAKEGLTEVRKGWLNDFYDDEAWWALAWIRAYDLTLDKKYLETAIEIFEDLEKGADTPCGGIWWIKARTYVNAITNELFLTVAASLANRVPLEIVRTRYLVIALKQWKWFEGSGLVNAKWNINDGLTRDCTNNNGTVWSYNQGVILEGLSELWIATGNYSYVSIAIEIAEAAIIKLTTVDKVLRDPCELNGCGADGVQFKGVFLRGLMALIAVLDEGTNKQRMTTFIKHNVKFIWNGDRDDEGRLGVIWSGPLKEINAGSQSSGLDAFVAAANLKSFRNSDRIKQ